MEVVIARDCLWGIRKITNKNPFKGNNYRSFCNDWSYLNSISIKTITYWLAQ